MCKSGAVCSYIAILLLFLSFLACAVAFVAPFWIKWEGVAGAIVGAGSEILSPLGVVLPLHQGLIGKCAKDTSKCEWIWNDNFKYEQELPDWHKAAQGLYAFGLAIMLAAVILALIHVICRCGNKSVSLVPVLGSVTIVGVILVAAGVIVFVGFAYQRKDVNKDDSPEKFDWACFTAIGGVAVALLSSSLYLCECCRRGPHGYTSTANA